MILATVILAGCNRQTQQPHPQQYPQYPQLEYPERRMRPPNQFTPMPPPRQEWQTKRFRGPWRTVANRRLDGIMECKIDRIGPQRYKGRFWGTWQGVDYDYTVQFSGRPEGLVGDPCVIDGASYRWSGSIINGQFNGSFTGSRYTGTFVLNEL
jgi:hypothetical protein